MMGGMSDEKKWGVIDYAVTFVFAAAIIYTLISGTQIWWR